MRLIFILLLLCYMNKGTSMLIPSDKVQDHPSATLSTLHKDFYQAAKFCANCRFYSARNSLKHFFYNHGFKEEFSSNSEKILNSLKWYYNFCYKNVEKLISEGKYSADYLIKDYVYYDFIDLFIWGKTPNGIITIIKQH